MDEPHPPGTFNVDTDEEVIEGIERNAYVRVATLLYLHDGSRGRLLTVDPAILQQALDRDASGTAALGDEACAQ